MNTEKITNDQYNEFIDTFSAHVEIKYHTKDINFIGMQASRQMATKEPSVQIEMPNSRFFELVHLVTEYNSLLKDPETNALVEQAKFICRLKYS